MPKFDLFFLPLLGGYLFFIRFNGTRYPASVLPAHRLIFPCAAFGIVFYLGARALVELESRWAPRRDLIFSSVVGEIVPGIIFACALFTGIACFTDRNKAQRYLRRQIHTAAHPLLVLAFSLYSFIVIGKARSDWGAYLLDVIVVGPIICAAVISTSWLLFKLTEWPIHALFFRVSVAVLILALLSAAMLIIPYEEVRSGWVHFIPMADAGVPALALSLAVGALLVGNFVLPPLAAVAYQNTRGSVNELRRLLFLALKSEVPVHFHTPGRKAYVGIVKSIPAQTSAAEGYFLLLPLMSGYRDTNTLEVEFTTFYDVAYRSIRDDIAEKGRLALARDIEGLRRLHPHSINRDAVAAKLRKNYESSWDDEAEAKLSQYYRVFPIADVGSLGYYIFGADFKTSVESKRPDDYLATG